MEVDYVDRRMQGNHGQALDPICHVWLRVKVGSATLCESQLPQVIRHTIPKLVK